MEQLHGKTVRQHVREGMELAGGVVAGRCKKGKISIVKLYRPVVWNLNRVGDEQIILWIKAVYSSF